MIAEMTGRVVGAERPAVPCDVIAVLQGFVRCKCVVHTFTAAHHA